MDATRKAILTAVRNLNADAYGVKIRDEALRLTGKILSFGGLYVELEWLEWHGYVTSSNGEATPERGNRPKRYYRITPKGMAALAE